MKSLKNKVTLYLTLLLLTTFLAPTVSAQSCQLDNVYLQAMPQSKITVLNSNNETTHFNVKTAFNNQTRAAGFQRVCAETIADKPILFIFDEPAIPQFHMRNVVAPIDIAFIDAQGRVESIQAMLTYVVGSIIQPLYSPKREVVAALEVEPGFYQKNNIEVGSVISWELDDADLNKAGQ